MPRKQRHTARRVWQRLVAEHGAGVAEVTVSRYVARRRAELGLDKVQVMVPQAHAPGAEAEVDFGEFHAVIAGALLKLWMFVMRLSCSGRAFHVAFATQAQEAFLEGHVLAFEYFGAVPGRVERLGRERQHGRLLFGERRGDRDGSAGDHPAVIDDVAGGDQLVQHGQRRDCGDGHQVAAAEPADLALHPALLMGAALARRAEERGRTRNGSAAR